MMRYEDYLALDGLLAAQKPTSKVDDEMLFIVVHQVHELWLKLMLHEIGHVGRVFQFESATLECVGSVNLGLRRSVMILGSMCEALEVLATMPRESFFGFRENLGSASGAQSQQFAELERLVRPGVPPHRFPGSLARAADVVTDELLSKPEVEWDWARDGQAPLALLALDEGLQHWKARHVEMVASMLGALPGTGGTAGVAHLKGRALAPYFPELRKAAVAVGLVPDHTPDVGLKENAR